MTAGEHGERSTGDRGDAEAAGQPGAQRRSDDDTERSRHRQQTGMQRGHSAGTLQEEGEVETLPGHGQEECGQADVSRGEATIAEQSRIEARVLFLPFGVQEARDQHHAGRDAAPHLPAAPTAALAAFDQAVGDTQQAERRQAQAERIEPATLRTARIRYDEGGADQAHGHDRQVDQEDRAPPEVVDQQTAEHRPCGDADAGGRGPDGDRAGPALGREDRTDDGHRGRHDHRAADPHQPAGHDQRDRVTGPGGPGRGSAEDGHSQHQDGPVTVAITECAGGEERGREEQRVDPQRPLQLARGGAEAVDRVGEALQRDAKHGCVDPDEHRGHNENREDPALPPLIDRMHWVLL